VGLAEREGAIHDPRGLDLEQVVDHRSTSGSILGFPGATDLPDTARALELDCDILVPAALENQITAENVDRVRARIVAEAANGPVTPEASDVLLARRTCVLPDLYLNSGGVIVSYFEWVKNLGHVRFGRMGKRFEESSNQRILRAVETLTGQEFEPTELARASAGAAEAELVNSGLEDTMITAYQEMLVVSRQRNVDLRSAAFIIAIEKVARAYLERGIFP
jgi:glutamate dehydrogenase (NAD(P)+)